MDFSAYYKKFQNNEQNFEVFCHEAIPAHELRDDAKKDYRPASKQAAYDGETRGDYRGFTGKIVFEYKSSSILRNIKSDLRGTGNKTGKLRRTAQEVDPPKLYVLVTLAERTDRFMRDIKEFIDHNELPFSFECLDKHDVEKWLGEITTTGPNWVYWFLKLDGQAKHYPKKRLTSVTAKLRLASNSSELEFVATSKGCVELKFRSTQDVLNQLRNLYMAGELEQKLGAKILKLEAEMGAALRIESRIVDNEYQSTIHYLPEVFGGRSLDEGFPPLVGGVAFPLNNPMQMGFSLLADSSREMPSAKEVAELQVRLARYLNTFLVLGGDQVNVTLNPLDDYCGLSKLLRNTELGRDMLAQDIVLKHSAACQLHPSTAHGKVFWDKVEAITTGPQTIESCFRVWIVPDKIVLNEKAKDGYGHVTIEKLGLKVMCASDYSSLGRFRELQGQRSVFTDIPRHEKQIIDLFKELIVPEIQREVSTGPRFGLLRQILSVLVIAKWVMGSQLGEALEKAGFLGSNAPEKYGLNTVDDEILLSMKRLYLRMFGDGIWRHTRTRIDQESNQVGKRLLVVGGIELMQAKDTMRIRMKDTLR